MLDAIDLTSRNGMDAGAMAAFGRGRSDKAAERAEALRLGQSVQDERDVAVKAREVAEDFVSVFMNQVMKSMRATVQENSFMHGDNGEKFFQEMLDTEQSKYLAKGSGYGLTDLIYQSLMSGYQASSVESERAMAEAAQNVQPAEAADEAAEEFKVEAIE